MNAAMLGPVAAAVGVLVVAGLMGLAGRRGRVRLVGPVAASAENIHQHAGFGDGLVRWIFLAALAAGALLHRVIAGVPAAELALPGLAQALLFVGGGVMVGLGLRLVEGPLSHCGGLGVGPRSAALAALTAAGAGLATAVFCELLLR
jgi:hypothetical protein